jgi:hypothetical protein
MRVFCVVLVMLMAACPSSTGGPSSGEGEGEGDAAEGEDDVAEGEGEGDVAEGEGEGDVAEGEGEGDVAEGEGEGDVAEGEGEGDAAEGEGEGDAAEGEGEGEPTCASDPLGFAACVNADAYQQDLVFMAQARTPGTPHWQAVQDACSTRLESLGFEVELHNYGTGINVVGTKPGATRPQDMVLVGAHYDGVENCAGADDNATGAAGVLEVARTLAPYEHEATLVVACWDEEELGLLGSAAYAQRASMLGSNIVVNFDFEMIGYEDDAPNSQELPPLFDVLFATSYQQVEANQFRGDFIALVGDVAANASLLAMQSVGASVGLPVVVLELTDRQTTSLLLGDLRRSDHASFWDIGVPAIMITDTANFRNRNYHCMAGPDSVDRLDQDFTRKVLQATVGAADQLLVRR